MATPLTVRGVSNLESVMTIGGDLLLLPRVCLPTTGEAFALLKGGIINQETSEIARNRLHREGLEDQMRYNNERRSTGIEPSWVLDRPIAVQKYLRHGYAIMEEDPLAIVGDFPFTGVSYMVTEGGLCEDIARAFNLFRLQGVRQLGFLRAPMIDPEHQMIIPPLDSRRYMHSLDVMALATLIGYNLGFPETEFNTLRVAAITHDFGTPAGGDSVKLVDPQTFDEDANYLRLIREKMSEKTWKRLRGRYRIHEATLYDTILNRGLLGEVLDIADKLSYVARDIRTCLQLEKWPNDDEGMAYVGTLALKEMVAMYPTICSIWESIGVVDDSLVFEDAGALIAFLKARIILFRELFYHPRARFGEYLISRLLVKKLYEEKKLTRKELLEMTDEALAQRLYGAYGHNRVWRILSLPAEVASFPTRDQASAFVDELVGHGGRRFFLVEDHLHSISTGTHRLVQTTKGVLPLSEAYPGDAKELYEMANMLPAVHVYYLKTETPEVKELFEPFFKK